jgi:excinuclease ABC subunit C
VAGSRKSAVQGEAVRERLASVPRRPGVYLFTGAREQVLYVGKARDLRSRLRSYFQKSSSLDARKRSMVEQVQDFSFIVTDTELEAFALEANLIKQHRPRFNVILRDDKNYPYLKLTLGEEWPRLEVARRIRKDGSLYFGPYVPAAGARETLAFVRRNLDIRPCRYRLDKPMRPCVQYQMGRCPAPCDGLVSRDEYQSAVDEAVRFLKGRKRELLEHLRERMEELSGEMRYEEAARVRDRLRVLERAMESQKVVAPELGDVDVVGEHRGERDVAFQVFFVRNGVMVGARDFALPGGAGIPPGELARSFIQMFYAKGLIPPREIIIGTRPDEEEQLLAWLAEVDPLKAGGTGRARVKLTVPRRGKKRDLLRMARENARLAAEGKGGGDVGEELRERLGLQEAPRRIGAFDVSNLGRSEAVGAYVLWADGDFVKDGYRRVRIRQVAGVDDYAMMRETVGRVLREGEPPDLVLIDGGRGHLEAARTVLEEAGIAVPVAAVAKRPDRLFLHGSDEALSLEDRNASSRLLRGIRDEVHRFAITYHKKLRDARALRSPLEAVAGMGPKRRLALLRRFKSLDAIREAPVEEIAGVPGMNRPVARRVKEALSGMGMKADAAS